ncbi:alpha/beta hydrolase, partial [Patescibacteria group bacterium]|nr:alpha/beta hydrolase [Patescibacteria group bacterium]
MIIVHGWGEHSDRYSNAVGYLMSYGYAVYGFDQRGNGRSPGKRGHINNWGEYRE